LSCCNHCCSPTGQLFRHFMSSTCRYLCCFLWHVGCRLLQCSCCLRASTSSSDNSIHGEQKREEGRKGVQSSALVENYSWRLNSVAAGRKWGGAWNACWRRHLLVSRVWTWRKSRKQMLFSTAFSKWGHVFVYLIKWYILGIPTSGYNMCLASCGFVGTLVLLFVNYTHANSHGNLYSLIKVALYALWLFCLVLRSVQCTLSMGVCELRKHFSFLFAPFVEDLSAAQPFLLQQVNN
jgi:hypothetical protein